MQRVAIARALANNPKIIMADEPTGALDTKTSIQIMNLIKEIAKDRLVIMVTHNPELANNYASRIIEFKDGNLVSDSNPIKEDEVIKNDIKIKRTSMNFLTALNLSFNNIITKWGRTLITAFASSIGIIGIALILLNLPRILVVDEPTAGLDPRERIRFRNLLVELSKDRIVIFSTHIIEDISSSCNQVAVVDKGELKYFGLPENMVDMAIGKVWQFKIDKESFETKLDKSLVVSNVQDGDWIQVRYISAAEPYPNAIQAEANLEDAYLCLLKNI